MDPRGTRGRILMAFPAAIATTRAGRQRLSIAGRFESASMFCVECGREGPTIDALCPVCFAKKHRLVEPPPHVDVPQCGSCGRFLVGSEWIREDLDAVIPGILRSKMPPLPPFTRVSFTHVAREEDASNRFLTVKASGRHEGAEVVQDFHTRLRLKPSLCDVCAKQRSRYYEGIVQVRAEGRELTPKEFRDVRTFVRARDDRARDASGDFVSRVEETHGGLDFYVSTNAFGKVLARELAETFGGSVTTSSKLFGQRGGRELHRVTSLVRLTAFQVGDVVRHKDRLAEVVKIATFLTLRDLESGEERRFKPRDLRAARRVDAERFATGLRAGAGGEVLATHPDSGAERPVRSRTPAKPGTAVVLWTSEGVYLSALPPDPSKG